MLGRIAPLSLRCFLKKESKLLIFFKGISALANASIKSFITSFFDSTVSKVVCSVY